MANSTNHLFLFTIGPVQSFISQARKTRDLYAGSRILSQLCRAGVKAAMGEGAKYIFPSEKAINNEDASLPNRFLVKFEGEIDAKSIGKTIEGAVKTYWNDTICKEVLAFKNIKGIKQQIDNHLEIFWVFNDYQDDYLNAYTEIESLLGAVKNSRSFTQFNYQEELGERGRKCSMDGERNVKFYRLGKDEKLNISKDGLLNKLYQKEDEVFIDNYKNGHFNHAQLQTGEGLSAVSMTKRLFEKTTLDNFPSTAKISLKKGIQNLNGFLTIKNYKDLFNKREIVRICDEMMNNNIVDNCSISFKEEWNTNFDYQYCYEENLTIKNFPNNSQLRLVRAFQSQKDFKKHLKQKYYAVIDFDGDKMGKWLGGDKIKDKTQLEKFHTDLSQCLTTFGDAAKKIVDKYGQTIYAGGDDFLGFLNLNYLFKAMSELRSEFKKAVNEELTTYRKDDEEISFSAGVCIAHYKEPLSLVLGKASKAQKSAKNEDKGDRNAFCITASKHSGEQHEAFYNWNNGESIEALEYIVEKIQHDDFSNTFIKSLQVEFSRLSYDKHHESQPNKLIVPFELLEVEIKRLVKNSYMGKRGKDEKKEEINQMIDNVKILYTSQSNHQLSNFFEALNICDFIQRSFDKPGAEKPTNKSILEPA